MNTHEELRQYRKRKNREVTAVQLRLDLEDFIYRKWGGTQTCKAYDWIVDNQGKVYTVDQETFEATYDEVSPGRYIKVAHVWAERARTAGVITTKEGTTDYKAGYWLVYNGSDRRDGYAMSPEEFAALYEPVESQ